jgi:pimeloyl-ACP methyl ester carboxylesterase
MRWSNPLRALQLCGALLAFSLCSTGLAAADEAGLRERNSPSCRDLTLPVTLAADRSEVFQVVGTLCWRGLLRDQTLQVLVHGITASRVYWDLPLRGEVYSYVQRATRAGFATFNFERIGIGASDRPPAADVTLDSNAFVLHQVVQALRTGTLAGVPFQRIIGVGHSFGSRAVERMEARFPGDVDGIISTGVLHDNGPDLAGILQTALLPASLDPRFAGQQIPPGYLTLVTGLQLSFLVDPKRLDPAIVAFHESLKETVTIDELVSLQVNDDARQLKVPVLLLVGEFDRVLCGNLVNCSDRRSILALESTFYGRETCLEVDIIRDAGHLFTLQRTPQAAYSTMLDWARRVVGVAADRAPRRQCAQSQGA